MSVLPTTLLVAGSMRTSAPSLLDARPAGFEPATGGLEVRHGMFQPVLMHPVICAICRTFARCERSIRPLRPSLYQPGCSTVAVHPAVLRENGAVLVESPVDADVSNEETHTALQRRWRGREFRRLPVKPWSLVPLAASLLREPSRLREVPPPM
jgi:hypothetical protein